MPQVTASFSAYPVAVTLDGSGNGTVAFQATGSNLRVTNIYVSVTTSTLQAACTISKGQRGPAYTIANTNSGSTGANASGTVGLVDGDVLYVTWTGGDPGSVATANFTGNKVEFRDARDTTTILEFSDPFAAGDGAIIFPALKSPNFVAGVSGWIVRRDGTFELGGGTFRGTVIVRASDGKGFILDPTTGVIYLYPEDSVTGAVVAPGQISPFLADAGAGTIAFTTIETPTVNGMSSAYIQMASEAGDGSVAPRIVMGGDVYSQDGDDMGRGIVEVWESPIDFAATINATELSVLSSGTARTYKANRAYTATVMGGFTCSTTAGNPIWRLRKTNAVGATVCYYRRTPTNTAGADEALNLTQVFTVGGADVSAVLTVCCAGSAAYDTNMLGLFGGRRVIIEDIGPASMYSAANVLT